ncbi:MAG: GxxExxY protein [Planctomycetota bacterium]
MDRTQLNLVSGAVVDSAIAVHRELGPGLLESAYEACLFFELKARGIAVHRQVELPIEYRGHRIETAYRLDLLVEQLVVLELKAVQAITDIHRTQLLSYLKLSKKPLGLLMNFNVELMKHGITRIAN